MIEIKLSSNSIDELRADVATLYSTLFGAMTRDTLPSQPSDAPEQADKPKRTRGPNKPKDAPAESMTPTELAKEAGLNAQQIPTSTESLFGGAAPVEQPKPVTKPTQKDLIVAFRALADKKGSDPIVALIAKYKATSVILIPEDQWPAAIADAVTATK